MTFAGVRRILRGWFGGKWGGLQDMKKQPKKKLSINKETIRRLTQTELELVRGGDFVEVSPPPPDQQQEVGTYRECLS